MSLVRVLRTAQVTLTHVFYVDEAPTDASGNVTATLKRLDGTTVNSATAGHPATGTYTYTVPAQAQLDSLTLDWEGTVAGAAVSVRDYVEIVGGFLFGLHEARAKRKPLSAATYTPEELAATRVEVEQDCEKICHTTFVPRFMRVAVPGSGRPDLLTPHADLRALRVVRIDGANLTAPEVAAIGVNRSGVLIRPGGAIWPWPGAIQGSTIPNIVLEYEHGLDAPPGRIASMAIVHLRSLLTETDRGTPSNAVSFTVADGGTYRLAQPGRDRTGIPEVDAVYQRYGQDLGGFA